MAVLSPQNVSPHGERPRSPAHSRPPNPLRYRLRDREKIKRVVSRMDSSDDDEIEDTLKRMPSLAWPGEDDVSTLSHGMRQMTTSLDNDATYVPGRGASSQGRKAPANAPKGKTKGGTGLQAWRILIRMLNNLFRRHHDKVKWKDVAGKINRYSEDDSRAFLKTLGLTPGEGPLPTWHSLTKDRVYEALADIMTWYVTAKTGVAVDVTEDMAKELLSLKQGCSYTFSEEAGIKYRMPEEKQWVLPLAGYVGRPLDGGAARPGAAMADVGGKRTRGGREASGGPAPSPPLPAYMGGSSGGGGGGGLLGRGGGGVGAASTSGLPSWATEDEVDRAKALSHSGQRPMAVFGNVAPLAPRSGAINTSGSSLGYHLSPVSSMELLYPAKKPHVGRGGSLLFGGGLGSFGLPSGLPSRLPSDLPSGASLVGGVVTGNGGGGGGGQGGSGLFQLPEDRAGPKRGGESLEFGDLASPQGAGLQTAFLPPAARPLVSSDSLPRTNSGGGLWSFPASNGGGGGGPAGLPSSGSLLQMLSPTNSGLGGDISYMFPSATSLKQGGLLSRGDSLFRGIDVKPE